MTKAPCYDEVNNTDCPDRKSLCMKFGRHKCPKWIAYEKIHKEELDVLNKKKYLNGIRLSYKRNYHK